jgi:hypothetical protein
MAIAACLVLMRIAATWAAKRQDRQLQQLSRIEALLERIVAHLDSSN